MASRTFALRHTLQPGKRLGPTIFRSALATRYVNPDECKHGWKEANPPRPDIEAPMPKPKDELTTPMVVEQRLHRPLTPHLGIYQPQLTWFMSAFHRLTGLYVGGALYAYLGAYALAPWMGWHLETDTLAAMVSQWPQAGKYAFKFAFAFPGSYYFLDTIRHEIWEMGYFLDLQGVYRTGYTVLAGTAVATIWLTFFK
jgi:succinate dehydrogenase (ubiquinone) cytochrome b560 subunit